MDFDAEIARRRELSEDELYDLLADELLPPGQGLGPAGRHSRRKFAREWLERVQQELRTGICSSPGVRALLEVEGRDQVQDAATIADFLLALNHQVPIATVSVIIARNGLDSYCAAQA